MENQSSFKISNFSSEQVCDESARIALENRYEKILESTHSFNRKLVSYQGNKGEIAHGWMRYKEGFSYLLVKRLIEQFRIQPNDTILDPFCGSGTTLLVCKSLGINAVGFEILPVCHLMWEAKSYIGNYEIKELANLFEQLLLINPQKTEFSFPHINITKAAFSEEVENNLMFYANLSDIQQDAMPYASSSISAFRQASKEAKTLYQLLITSVLEEISYTRKDGQYLRWDYRSTKVQQRNKSRIFKGRKPTKKFDKGEISTVKEAISRAFKTILSDIKLLNSPVKQVSWQELNKGSVLENLPKYKSNQFSSVITSPPYCNRYDYTRTYALELAYLNVDELEIKNLRQNQLCCTVENKTKLDKLKQVYSDVDRLNNFETICEIITGNRVYQEINSALKLRQQRGEINNSGILSMVEGYFYELTFLFFEMFRTCKNGANVAIVNDNVRYGGEIIPVDTLCTEIAETIGFVAEKIYVLPQRKGNSSQQMKRFGKESLRKSITVWRKP